MDATDDDSALLRAEVETLRSVKRQQTTAKKLDIDEKYLADVKRMYYRILVTFLVCVGVFVAWVLIDIHIRFGDVMSDYGTIRDDSMPSEFDLGLALRFPPMTRWGGWLAPGLPEAIYISLKSILFRPAFLPDIATGKSNLGQMYWYAMHGSGGGGTNAVDSNASALSLICNSWGYTQKIQDCKQPCPSGIGAYGSEKVSTAVNGFTQFGMGFSMSPGPTGFVLGCGMAIASVGGALGWFRSKKEKREVKEQREHCIGDKSSAKCSIM